MIKLSCYLKGKYLGTVAFSGGKFDVLGEEKFKNLISRVSVKVIAVSKEGDPIITLEKGLRTCGFDTFRIDTDLIEDIKIKAKLIDQSISDDLLKETIEDLSVNEAGLILRALENMNNQNPR